MRNIGILIGRDFSTRVKGGSYIVTTLLGMLVIIGLAFIPVITDWFETRFDQTAVDLLLLDKTGALTQTITSMAQQPHQNLNVTVITDLSEDEAIEQFKTADKTGLLVVDYDTETFQPIYTLHTDSAANINQNSAVQRIINQANTQYNATQLGLSLDQVQLLFQSPYLNVKEIIHTDEITDVDKEENQSQELTQTQAVQSMVLAYLLLFIIYMALILYGNMVATGVAEEKSSRIMEVMVASVKPVHLMIGKIIGIGSLGLLQFVIWIATGLIVITLRNLGFSLGSIPIGTLAWFGLFFLLGYLFYATIFAAAGAIVSRVEEVQQVITILMMALVAGFFVAYISFLNPNSTFATVSSIIPLFSPMVMFSRVTLANPPVIQIILSVLFLLIGIAINTWIGAKIYRVGVLMYGKRPNIKEIFRYVTS